MSGAATESAAPPSATTDPRHAAAVRGKPAVGRGPGPRLPAMTVWAALFTGGCFLIGLPTDPLYAFAWLWAATIAWNSHLPWRAHLRFGRDWAPLAVLLVVYNLSRGYADNGATPHVRELIDVDTHMWGWATGGLTPTVWLQRHLYDPAHVHWWDLLVSAVYFSHFVTVPTIAAVLWLRNRSAAAAFMGRWVALFAAGLATYFIYPAAPPWWASVHGLIAPVSRISTRGWAAIGLHGAGNMLNAAQLDAANPIAAMPSLHTAFATLCAGFFIPRVAACWRPLLACYPLAMMFTLVYSGEHWVIDTFFGIGYALVVLLAAAGLERLRHRRRTGRARSGLDPRPPADVTATTVAAFGDDHARVHPGQGG